MSASDVLRAARAGGLVIWAFEDRVRVQGPAGSLSAALRASIAEYRDEILDLLRDEHRNLPCACGGCERTGVQHGPRCYCGPCLDADPKWQAACAEPEHLPADLDLVHFGEPCTSCGADTKWRTTSASGCWRCEPPAESADLQGADPQEPPRE